MYFREVGRTSELSSSFFFFSAIRCFRFMGLVIAVVLGCSWECKMRIMALTASVMPWLIAFDAIFLEHSIAIWWSVYTLLNRAISALMVSFIS